MAIPEQTEFTFPDETPEQDNPRKGGRVVEPAAEDAPEIEVVDDTPEADRGREPLPEPPQELTEDELKRYDASVQSRIKKFTKGYHDERRAKEAAEREREEALRLAQQVLEENKQLRGSLSQNQQTLLETAKKNVATEVEAAKAKLRAATEAFDPDAVVEAQEALMKATLKAEQLRNYRATPSQERETAVQPTQAPAPQPVDSKAAAWQQQNSWFGQDEEMTSFALGLHTKLVRQGVDPKSDEYYQKLNARLRQVFPDQFDDGGTADAPTPPRSKSTVAPAARSVAPRKVTLTQTQVALAKRLGLPLEVYARQVAKEMTQRN